MGITKISPTLIGSGYVVTLWLCRHKNGLITLPPFIWLSRNFFCIHLSQKGCPPIFFLWQGPVGLGPRAKKHWFVMLSQLFHKLLVWKQKIKLKIEKQNSIIIFSILAECRGPSSRNQLCQLWTVVFMHKSDPKLICILNSNWPKKIWLAQIWPVGRHAKVY